MSHVEQSRNTLYFATRAKEVTNNAQVNMVLLRCPPWLISFSTDFKRNTNTDFFSPLNTHQVVSDKQLVKHLQKEVARLEAELRTPDPKKEKDFKIQQVRLLYISGLTLELVEWS